MNWFTVSGLSAGYGGKVILKDISFTADPGRMVGILGANGSGKTTLLKAICGILPHSGVCTLQGTALEKLSPKQLAAQCSYIPQRSGISIDISALDVVLMGFNPHLRLLEHPTAQMRETAKHLLAQVGLSDKEHSNYLHLSEGQKQLCILARTLAADGKLMLLDEPESALDFRLRTDMLHLLRTWLQQGQRSALVSLHDPFLALNCCDELLLLHQGTLIGRICPRQDPPAYMEQQLSVIYGPVSLHQITDRADTPHLIMIKEDDV